jgi:hypothetical protein
MAWQDHVWRGGGDGRVLGDDRVDEGEGEAVGGAGAVADGLVGVVADGEDLTVVEFWLFQRSIQCLDGHDFQFTTDYRISANKATELASHCSCW